MHLSLPCHMLLISELQISLVLLEVFIDWVSKKLWKLKPILTLKLDLKSDPLMNSARIGPIPSATLQHCMDVLHHQHCHTSSAAEASGLILETTEGSCIVLLGYRNWGAKV